MLAFISAKHRIFHAFDTNSKPFLHLFMPNPLSYVFDRNEENKTKIKRFGQELKEFCKKEAMVETTTFYGCEHKVILQGRLL